MLFEQGRLTKERVVDVSVGSAIKPDELKVLLKLIVPDIEKTADRLRKAIGAYAYIKGASSDLMMAAQDQCEEAFNWISQVVDRCKEEQLHLDAKHPAKEADFQPFCCK
jgi:hypothetical protein